MLSLERASSQVSKREHHTLLTAREIINNKNKIRVGGKGKCAEPSLSLPITRRRLQKEISEGHPSGRQWRDVEGRFDRSLANIYIEECVEPV